MKRLGIGAAFMLAFAIFTADAGAQTTLRVANWLPPTHPLVKDIIEVWIADVEEATEGRVQLELLASPLGPPPAHFDFAVNGVADVTYGVHNYTPGRFAATELAELPFLSDKAEDLSVAYWRVHEKYLAKADEHRGTKVLAVFTHGPGQLYTTEREIAELGDLDGLKVRVGGGISHEVAKALGLVAVQAPSTQAYEILAQGVADGIQFPAESIGFFNLHEVMKHGVLFPGGLYSASFFIVMNQAKWDSLSPEDQKAIESVSGEKLARTAGAAWDRADDRGRASMAEAGLAEKPASDALVAAVRKAVAPVIENTLAKIEAKGVDAQAAYEMLQAEVAAAKASR